MALVSFQSLWASILLFDSSTKTRWLGLLLKTLTNSTQSLCYRARTWTQDYHLPAQHFPPGLHCPFESLRQQLLQNSAVQSGVRMKPIPQGHIILSAQRGWEDGMVYPDQQGALETGREREEEQKSWPKEQPFKMISLCKFNCKDRWIFQQGWRENYEICFLKAIRFEKLRFKNSYWIEKSNSMTVWSVLARLSIMLSKQVIHIFCSFFY